MDKGPIGLNQYQQIPFVVARLGRNPKPTCIQLFHHKIEKGTFHAIQTVNIEHLEVLNQNFTVMKTCFLEFLH